MPGVSESGEAIARLLAAGLSGQDIGRAIGRDRSLVSQVARGVKPGTNLRDALGALERQVGGLAGRDAKQAARRGAVPEPPRRQTGPPEARRPANVRKPTTRTGRAWGTSTAKRQAVRAGAHGFGHPLADAADARRTVAVTVGTNAGLRINNTSGGKVRGAHVGAGAFDMQLGPADQVWAEVQAQHGGNFSAYVAAQALERGLISGVADEREAVQHFTSLELRSY